MVGRDGPSHSIASVGVDIFFPSFPSRCDVVDDTLTPGGWLRPTSARETITDLGSTRHGISSMVKSHEVLTNKWLHE